MLTVATMPVMYCITVGFYSFIWCDRQVVWDCILFFCNKTLLWSLLHWYCNWTWRKYSPHNYIYQSIFYHPATCILILDIFVIPELLPVKYHAFISYSHSADSKLAPALQNALEKFAKPWYKLRNLNIFLDEGSLAASPHLWSNIEEALRKSDHLIYMASPASASSKWVKKEIQFWLENK